MYIFAIILFCRNDQEYPCISTYLVKVQDKKYYLYSPSDISDKISKQAAADYQKFMTTKTYTDYTKAYEVFLKKNPGYEDKIASKTQWIKWQEDISYE